MASPLNVSDDLLSQMSANKLVLGDAASRSVTASVIDLSIISALEINSGGDVTFGNTLDGGIDLTVNSGGTTTFQRARRHWRQPSSTV
ncbi:MAG: hypothetical protein MO846_06350 [Candidatus Devosia symbiotica]|nr:hypothetical protein [Candidatus Devosia symbiotica]